MEQCTNFQPIVDFVRERHPPTRAWKPYDMLKWICLAAVKGWLVTVYDNEQDRNLMGVMIVRPVSEIPPDNDVQTFDPKGNIIHIDLAVASGRPAMRALAEGGMQLMGPRPLVALRSKGRVRIHETRRVWQALFK